MVAGGCSQSRNVCNKMFYLNTITRNFFRTPYGTIPKNLNLPHANKKLCVWQCENTMIPLFHNVEIRIKRSQETFLGFSVVPSRRTRISPMQTWILLFDNGKIQWFLLFHNVKIRIKHWNIGPTIPLEIVAYFFWINLDSSEVSTLFLTGNAKKTFLHYLKMHYLTTFETVSDVCLSKFSYNNRYLESESSKRNLSTVDQCTSGQYLISSEWIHEGRRHESWEADAYANSKMMRVEDFQDEHVRW
jgi:hypothetical protein